MGHLGYEYSKLKTDYYLRGIEEYYRAEKALPPPSYVIWDSTRRCNLHCIHCGAIKEQYEHELTTGQVKGILEQLAALNIGMFAVTGGEPLLRKDLPEVLSYAHQLGLKTGIATNGTLIDRPAAEWIKSARVYSVQVSLDGLQSTHNWIRGNQHSFTRAIHAIELLKEQGVPLVSVATTVTINNIAEIADLRQLLIQSGIKLWRLTVVMPIGRARAANLCPDDHQLVDLLKYVKEHQTRELRIYIGENLTYLGDWERQVRQKPTICPIGYTACCIGVDGSVRGCPEQLDTPENQEGSLLVTSFESIWKTGFRRYRTREILTKDENCARCKVKNDCYGGCWVMRADGQNCIYHLLGQVQPRLPRKIS
jgi:radical SAM protein with 4Fe4S-binding SPASM domain